MKKLFILLFICTLLVGCREQVEGVYPEASQETIPLSESKLPPRQVNIHQDGFTGLSTQRQYFCWAEQSLNECLTELPEGYFEIIDKIHPSTLNKDITASIDMQELDHTITLPLPNKKEVFLVNDGQLEPVEMDGNRFQLPEKEDIYTYLIKTTYESENIGVAFYAFRARVEKIEEKDGE